MGGKKRGYSQQSILQSPCCAIINDHGVLAPDVSFSVQQVCNTINGAVESTDSWVHGLHTRDAGEIVGAWHVPFEMNSIRFQVTLDRPHCG